MHDEIMKTSWSGSIMKPWRTSWLCTGRNVRRCVSPRSRSGVPASCSGLCLPGEPVGRSRLSVSVKSRNINSANRSSSVIPPAPCVRARALLMSYISTSRDIKCLSLPGTTPSFGPNMAIICSCPRKRHRNRRRTILSSMTWTRVIWNTKESITAKSLVNKISFKRNYSDRL